MSGFVWLVSHGGVGSEHLYDQLNLAYPDIRIRGRPLRGVVSHLPAPYRIGPRKCIYLFGWPIDAVLSQMRRNHYDNPRKLRNNVLHPTVHSLGDLLSTINRDPFGINQQFTSFCREFVDYPILLLKRSAISRHLEFVSGFAETEGTLRWLEQGRSTDRTTVPLDALDHLEKLYGITEKIMEQMPDIALRLPVWITGYHYRLDPSDVIDYCPILGATSVARSFLQNLVGPTLENARTRLKHAYEWVNTEGEHLCFVNVRYDIEESGWGSIGYLLKINYNTGQILKVSHEDILEDRIFSGAEDPRYFWRRDQLGIIFNALCRDGTRRIFIYFVHLDHCIKLQTPGFTLRDIEKNWTVLVVGDVIYVVYSFNPPILFRLDDDKTGFCSMVSECAFVLSGPIEPLYPYGGSSLCLWGWPYFIGLVHSRSPYRPAFIVFDAEEMRVVAVGEPFSVPEPVEAIKWRGRDVQYPYHLEVDHGRCELWIECQDRCPTVYRFEFTRFCEVVSTLIAVKPVFGEIAAGKCGAM